MYSQSQEEWARDIAQLIALAEEDGYCVFNSRSNMDDNLMIGFTFPENDDMFITEISV